MQQNEIYWEAQYDLRGELHLRLGNCKWGLGGEMIEYIFHQLHLYRMYEDREPESIYLGYDEMRRLMADKDIFKYISFTSKGKDAKFNGIQVFEVCQENHFNIC